MCDDSVSSKDLWNVGKFLPGYTAQILKRQTAFLSLEKKNTQ
jgi:hypothetical protein